MVLALALHLDPVFVGALHLSRFLLVSLLVPFLAHRLQRGPQTSQSASARRAPAVRRSRISYSAASGRSLSGRPSLSQTSTSASASASISASS